MTEFTKGIEDARVGLGSLRSRLTDLRISITDSNGEFKKTDQIFLEIGEKMEEDKTIELQLVMGELEMSLSELLSLRKGLNFQLNCSKQQRGVLKLGNTEWAEVLMTFEEDSLKLEISNLIEDRAVAPMESLNRSLRTG